MVWPKTVDKEEIKAMIDDKIKPIQLDVDTLKVHREACDHLHEQHKEHKRRSDDAMNNLTDSNMMLAKSIADMNITITEVVGIIKRDESDISLVKDTRAAYRVGKWIFGTLVTLALGMIAFSTFYDKFSS